MAKQKMPSNINWSGVTAQNRLSKIQPALVASNDKPITKANQLNDQFARWGNKLKAPTNLDTHL